MRLGVPERPGRRFAVLALLPFIKDFVISVSGIYDRLHSVPVLKTR